MNIKHIHLDEEEAKGKTEHDENNIDRSFDIAARDGDNNQVEISSTQQTKGNGGQQQMGSSTFKLTSSEKRSLVLIFLLYFIEGLTIGFYIGSLPILLAEKGIEYSEIGILSFARLFLSVKPIFAPFVDTVSINIYSETLGRRKTYIVPIQYLLGSLYIWLSMYMEDWIDQLKTGMISFCAILFVMLTSIHEIAASGWGITLVRKEASSSISVVTIMGKMIMNSVELVGNILGMLISNNIFIQLNSRKFCNKYIYSSYQIVRISTNYYNLIKHPVLTTNDFLRYQGIFLIAVTIIIHFFKKEDNPQTFKSRSTLKVLMMVKGFYTNPNLKFLCIFLMIWKIGYSPIESVWLYRMIQKGFPKEILSAIQAFSIPLQMLNNMVAGFVARKHNEMRIILFSLILRLLENLYNFMVISNFDLRENLDSTILLLIIFQIMNVIEGGCISVALGSFFNRIADPNIGGTYISTLQSTYNLGRQCTDIFLLFLNSYVDFPILASMGWLYTAILITFTSDRLLKLESLEPDQFKLEKEPEQTEMVPKVRMHVSAPIVPRHNVIS